MSIFNIVVFSQERGGFGVNWVKWLTSIGIRMVLAVFLSAGLEKDKVSYSNVTCQILSLSTTNYSF